MPFTLRFTRSGTDVRFSGVATRAVIEAAYEAVAARAHGGGQWVLRDYAAADRIEVTSADVRALAGLHERREDEGEGSPDLVAIVAPRPADYGVARMWEMLSELASARSRVLVAHTRAEAVAWLVEQGVPAEELEP